MMASKRRATTAEGQTETSGIRASFPELKPSRRLVLEKGDLLITTAGFEDRALAAGRSVQINGPPRAIVLTYKPEDPRNRIQSLLAVLRAKGFRREAVDLLEYDRFAPETFPAIVKGMLEQADACRVVVDVSAMSKLASILILDVCRERDCDVKI